MKLSWETRIARLERQRDVLRAQLPLAGPGRSERLQLTELLALVTGALSEVRRRQALKHRRDLAALADLDRAPYGTASKKGTARAMVSHPSKIAPFVKAVPPDQPACALARPSTASWRATPEGPLEYEVVWPRQERAS